MVGCTFAASSRRGGSCRVFFCLRKKNEKKIHFLLVGKQKCVSLECQTKTKNKNTMTQKKLHVQALKNIKQDRHLYFDSMLSWQARFKEADPLRNQTGYSLEGMAEKISDRSARIIFLDKYIGWLESPTYTEGVDYLKKCALEDARAHVLSARGTEALLEAQSMTAAAHDIEEAITRAENKLLD